MTDRYLERTGTVRALMSCMLTGRHSLLLGPPGTAKSELARDLTGRMPKIAPDDEIGDRSGSAHDSEDSR
ncbi:MoxR-like ATPase [Streptosporangium lutulentum]|uniref:MoxR-like ATPase n=1 Tax=Streptosporangium lutulentum TaxID=1461250 RepID=A0ABT9Q5U4_9ACTN|nr:ATP-binding protein [Streptosporangium lutulentum]MDP9842115.1 MoxR-like ATPase [Streptosporangium lutulentum]